MNQFLEGLCDQLLRPQAEAKVSLPSLLDATTSYLYC